MNGADHDQSTGVEVEDTHDPYDPNGEGKENVSYYVDLVQPVKAAEEVVLAPIPTTDVPLLTNPENDNSVSSMEGVEDETELGISDEPEPDFKCAEIVSPVAVAPLPQERGQGDGPPQVDTVTSMEVGNEVKAEPEPSPAVEVTLQAASVLPTPTSTETPTPIIEDVKKEKIPRLGGEPESEKSTQDEALPVTATTVQKVEAAAEEPVAAVPAATELIVKPELIGTLDGIKPEPEEVSVSTETEPKMTELVVAAASTSSTPKPDPVEAESENVPNPVPIPIKVESSEEELVPSSTTSTPAPALTPVEKAQEQEPTELKVEATGDAVAGKEELKDKPC